MFVHVAIMSEHYNTVFVLYEFPVLVYYIVSFQPRHVFSTSS